MYEIHIDKQVDDKSTGCDKLNYLEYAAQSMSYEKFLINSGYH